MDEEPSARIDIRNKRYTPEEELFIEQYSGRDRDLPPRVQQVAGDDVLDDLDQGDWITVVDGEVIETGHAHPFSVRVEL